MKGTGHMSIWGKRIDQRVDSWKGLSDATQDDLDVSRNRAPLAASLDSLSDLRADLRCLASTQGDSCTYALSL